MNNLLRALLFLLAAAPAAAADLFDYGNLKVTRPPTEAAPLVAEINSTIFAPKLFGFGPNTTIEGLSRIGFDCGFDEMQNRTFCRHDDYALLPNPHEREIKQHLFLSFGGKGSDCPGVLMEVTYHEDIYYNAFFGRFAHTRYEKIVKAIAHKYGKYEGAEARLSSETHRFLVGFGLGHKIEVINVNRGDDYYLEVNYRTQCAVDALQKLSDSMMGIANAHADDLVMKL